MNYKFEFDTQTLQIVLAGLDKLPGEISRPLHNAMVQSAQQQEADATREKAKPEAKPKAETKGEQKPQPKSEPKEKS